MRITIHDRDPSGARAPGASWFRGAESMLAGAGAGLITSVVTCPLDVVKTKLQAGGAQGGPQGLVGTFQHIWTHDGFRGLYRGLGPTVIGYLPTWAIYFTVYDQAKSYFSSVRGPDDPISHILAAMTAGASGTILTNPLWVVKTRFMTQQVAPRRAASSGKAATAGAKPGAVEEPYKSTWDALRRIYAAEGVTPFYRGLLPSLFGVVHVAIQFPVYERMKVVFRPEDGSDIPSSTILLCSSASKMIASIATYPHEVLRTRLQIQKHQRAGPASNTSSSSSPAAAPSSSSTSSSSSSSHGSSAQGRPAPSASSSSSVSVPPPSSASSTAPTTRAGGSSPVAFEGLVATFNRILRDEGGRGFYRGMMTNLIRTVPSSALTILSYELLMRRLVRWTHTAQEIEDNKRRDGR
ncbi:hypothetical protein JCM8097_008196 [Rhodosporidiobolus ruineniae]